MRRIAPAIAILALVACVSIWMSYGWVMDNVSQVVAKTSPERLERIEARIHQIPDLASLQGGIDAPSLFLNNTRAVAFIFLVGLFSFGVLGILFYMVNIGLIGGLFAAFQLLGMKPWPMFLAGVVPHGIFEIPALMIGSAAVLYMGASIVTPQLGKSMGEVILELFADWAKIFLGVVVPLLAIAAVIEAYITPGLLLSVMTK